MYIPELFREDEPAVLLDFIREHSFGVIVTGGPDPQATHVPFMIEADRGDKGALITHLARVNSHWESIDELRETLVIFQGPHCYISPSWYDNQVTVPTWVYAAVHVRGRAHVIEESGRLREIVTQLVAVHEHSWDLSIADPVMDTLLGRIVGIEILIDSIQGKFKFNQNTSREDQAGVIEALSTSDQQTEREVAAIMRRNLAGNE